MPRLVDYLFRYPVISIPAAKEALEVGSYHTAQKIVERLAGEEILRQIGPGHVDRVFVAKAILDVVGWDA